MDVGSREILESYYDEFESNGMSLKTILVDAMVLHLVLLRNTKTVRVQNKYVDHFTGIVLRIYRTNGKTD